MAITDGIITLTDARKSIYGEKYATAPTTNDTDLERYVEAATPVIEGIAGPVIGRSRTFTFDGGLNAYQVPVKIRTVTSVTVNGVATTDYVAHLDNGIIYPGSTAGIAPFAPGLLNVSIVVVVGYATSADYPVNVVLAARELVRFWWQQGRQANRPGVAEVDPSAALPGSDIYKRVWQLLKPTPGLAGFA